MHMRKITQKKQLPAGAFNFEQVLFLVNGIIGVVQQLTSVGSSKYSLYTNLIS